MDSLDPDELCRIIGRLVLDHEVAMARQKTIFMTRIKQLESEQALLRKQPKADVAQ